MPDVNTYLLIAILVLIAWPRPKGKDAQLQRIERKLTAILKELNLDPNAQIDPQVLELAATGQKIEAIKLYREQTGVSLREAKEFVESL